MLTCRVDNDCFLGHICLHNRCEIGCHHDEDCSPSESCDENKCRSVCEKNPCGPGAFCTVANQRASCTCGVGLVPSPNAKIGCVRSPALVCSENRDCTIDQACFNGYCYQLCGNDGECINNERCDNGACKPICQRDDDCNSGEICKSSVCSSGCRSDLGCPGNLACLNNRCIDPCKQIAACGTNSECSIENHKIVCKCQENLVGNPQVGCKRPMIACQNKKDCENDQMMCYGSQCKPKCGSNNNCLADEKCVKGMCRSICSSDSQCESGFICKNRMCELGCRSDNSCPDSEACINNQCTDPCKTVNQCGTCAECHVFNHGMQCVCKNKMIGDPLTHCTMPIESCNSNCQCDESGMYCNQKCKTSNDCGCGQSCSKGICRHKCDQSKCAPGQICQDSADGKICVDGCKKHTDCQSDMTCTNGKCKNGCEKTSCGKDAICRVTDHKGTKYLTVF